MVLFVDAAINIVLGVLLVTFPRRVVDALGIPASESAFYPSILGGVLMGIGIALLIQVVHRERFLGLGHGGAVAINICGGLVLAAWLIWGGLDIPVRGQVLLWSLVTMLVGISLVELMVQRTRPKG